MLGYNTAISAVWLLAGLTLGEVEELSKNDQFVKFCAERHERYLHDMEVTEGVVETLVVKSKYNRIQIGRFNGLECFDEYWLVVSDDQPAMPLDEAACIQWQRGLPLPPGHEKRLNGVVGSVSDYSYRLLAKDGEISRIENLSLFEGVDRRRAKSLAVHWPITFGANSIASLVADGLYNVEKWERAKGGELYLAVLVDRQDLAYRLELLLGATDGLLRQYKMLENNILYASGKFQYSSEGELDRAKLYQGTETEKPFETYYLRPPKHINVPREELLISAFGFEEPLAKPAESRNSIVWWMIIAGGVLIGTAVLINWKYK